MQTAAFHAGWLSRGLTSRWSYAIAILRRRLRVRLQLLTLRKVNRSGDRCIAGAGPLNAIEDRERRKESAVIVIKNVTARGNVGSRVGGGSGIDVGRKAGECPSHLAHRDIQLGSTYLRLGKSSRSRTRRL